MLPPFDLIRHIWPHNRPTTEDCLHFTKGLDISSNLGSCTLRCKKSDLAASIYDEPLQNLLWVLTKLGWSMLYLSDTTHGVTNDWIIRDSAFVKYKEESLLSLTSASAWRKSQRRMRLAIITKLTRVPIRSWTRFKFFSTHLMDWHTNDRKLKFRIYKLDAYYYFFLFQVFLFEPINL